ncbi:MAG TPA: 2-phospho-L-lactate transferase [Methanotrichaceae archaeon]|nr:2-phospho-L-lactate transferase [Methanotrichaceae archaeon]
MIVLSGGTGTPKLLAGLKQILDPGSLTVIVNTAEDIWASGNLISPDVDTVLYTLAGLADESKWWGIRGDTFHTHDRLKSMGFNELLSLGDLDRATHIYRSELIRRGESLSDATTALADALGIKQAVLPMSDDPVSTMITTEEGEMHLQEYWVGLKGTPDVRSIRLEGIDRARPSPGFVKALSREDTVLIGPSNPVTSIGPILALPGIRSMIEDKYVVAVSPLAGDKPFSGPAAKFMRAMGVPTDDRGVAELLGHVDLFVVSQESSYQGECLRVDTLMKTGADSLSLAKRIIGLMPCSLE